MSRERELLTRLYLALPDGDELPRIMNEVRALLAEPEGEDAAGLSVICRDCGMLVAGEMAGNRVRWVECQSCKPPRSRAEAEAMVEAGERLLIERIPRFWLDAAKDAGVRWCERYASARAALLAALTRTEDA